MRLREFVAARLDEQDPSPLVDAARALIATHYPDRDMGGGEGCRGCGFHPNGDYYMVDKEECITLLVLADGWINHPDHPDPKKSKDRGELMDDDLDDDLYEDRRAKSEARLVEWNRLRETERAEQLRTSRGEEARKRLWGEAPP